MARFLKEVPNSVWKAIRFEIRTFNSLTAIETMNSISVSAKNFFSVSKRARVCAAIWSMLRLNKYGIAIADRTRAKRRNKNSAYSLRFRFRNLPIRNGSLSAVFVSTTIFFEPTFFRSASVPPASGRCVRTRVYITRRARRKAAGFRLSGDK